MPDEPAPQSPSPDDQPGDRTIMAAPVDADAPRATATAAQPEPLVTACQPAPRRKTPGVPDVPLPQGEPPRLRRFALLLAAIAVLVVVLVAGFNAVVDPYGTVGTGLFPTVTWSDRALKVDLVRELPQPPQLLILGSSRAMKLQPRYIKTKTGDTAFNAAVSSGRPLDAWAFVNLIHDTYPDDHPGYLWLLDVEAFRPWPPDPGLINTPELAAYLPADVRRGTRLKDLKLLISLDTAEMSLKSVREKLRQESNGSGGASSGGADFSADGFRRHDYHDTRAQAGVPLAAELRKTIRQAGGTYRDDYRKLDPEAERYFEKTLALMNKEGATPVIVLSPQHPQVTAAVGALGWNARRRQLLAFLRSLQGRYELTLLDFTNIASFGGDPQDFYDGYHMTVANTRLLIDAVLEKDPDGLR